ncbi:MAG TPA: divergent PAP2 family protein [Candidatus Treponema faecavium]|nr:divergent PAP2 family protein [Candidatus Treponema faecavium]
MLSEAGAQFRLLFSNPVFLACLFSWFSAQFIKTVIKLFAGQVKNIKQLLELLIWRTGGMPSSHSALVCSLSTSIGIHAGLNSDIFILSLCFSMVVIRDALGVRRASGVQARVLNEIGESLDKQDILSFKPIKEVHGHKPLEVFVGCFLGILIGIAFSTK